MDHRNRLDDKLWNTDAPEDYPLVPVDPLDLDEFKLYLAQALYEAGMPEGSVKGFQSGLGPGLLVEWHGKKIQVNLLERSGEPSGLKLHEISKDVTSEA